MKNKKLLIATTLLSSLGLVAAIIPASIATSKAINDVPSTLSNEINATKPGRGETVNFLPDALTRFMEMDNLLENYPNRASEIGELTPYNDELYSWTAHAGNSDSDKNYRRAIFEKYDIYRPTNNLLAWNSSIDAREYRVIISQDKSFATIEREYTVSGTENSVIFENPYTGTDYYWQVIATKNDNSSVYSDIFNFTVANLPRTVNIQGVSNTRDIGGDVGLDNKRVKEGLVYRGMGLEAITSAGENEFRNQLGIKTEIDLRNVGEGVENYLNLSNYYHYPAPLDYMSNSGDAWGIEWEGTGSLLENFGNVIKVLSNKNNYPVYFHCSVGRDRTGWLGLVLDWLCGVSEDIALKKFCLSLFSTSGAYTKGNTAFYERYLRIRDYINTFDGNNLSEKIENYLTSKCGVTAQECDNVRKILLGDIAVDFVPGQVNPTPYTNLARVAFRKYGETSIIKMVQIGSLLEEPNVSGSGAWYYGNRIWNFDLDTVQGDMQLDYLTNDKFKVVVHYSGIDMPDDVFDVDNNYEFDLTIFDRDGYTCKVYDDSYNRITSLIVTSDISINVVYTPTSGYIPKSNSRIIVMAGQSNAAGVAHYQYLENSLDEAKIAEINAGYDNVQMMGYSHGAEMPTFRKVYADKRYNTAGSPGTFGFEVGLADRLSKVYPDETTYIIKYGYGGTSLNHDWISPSCYDVEELPALINTFPRGWLYTGLVEALTSAISMISSTTNTIPMVEAFMWMQGEADAESEMTTNLYLSTFNSMIDDFTNTFRNNISYKFTVYDAAISETSIWPLAKQMNSIKRNRVDEHNVFIDTNARLTTLFEPVGSSTDVAHYDAACYIDLGHMFADAYLEKTLRGYTHNYIEIEAPAKVTLTLGETIRITDPTIFFNGEVINNAKISYFAEQHRGFNNYVYSFFTVNNDNSFTATRVGESQLRITAYYNHEVRTILVPVEVVS